jgi:hypothetical protein
MKIENTKTEVSLVTIRQRIKMLSAPPKSPVKGRNSVRHCLTGDKDCVDYILSQNSPHFTAVSVREAVNRFGRLGTPKYVFCSPEMFELFN